MRDRNAGENGYIGWFKRGLLPPSSAESSSKSGDSE